MPDLITLPQSSLALTGVFLHPQPPMHFLEISFSSSPFSTSSAVYGILIICVLQELSLDLSRDVVALQYTSYLLTAHSYNGFGCVFM